MSEFTHFDAAGNALMVDVSDKADTARVAVAQGKICVSREIYEKIVAGSMAKGDVLGVARVAGIMAAKRTSELIPLCHLLQLTKCTVDLSCWRKTAATLYRHSAWSRLRARQAWRWRR